MSIWTHVVGCIRVDGIPQLGASVEKLKDVIGPICSYDGWNEVSTLPCGSEGSMQYQVIEYYGGLPWVAIPVWGDLRDYDNVDEIEKWWNETLPKLGMIRDAVLHVQIEGREPKVLSWKQPEWEPPPCSSATAEFYETACRRCGSVTSRTTRD